MLLAANICAAATVNQVPADWTTYRVDLVTTGNYSGFGGGPSGDIFHMYFDFNRAYLPYDMEYVSDGFGFGTSGMGFMPDASTPDPFDFVQMEELAIHGSQVVFEVNGRFIGMAAPWAFYVADGQITSVGYSNTPTSHVPEFRINSEKAGALSGTFSFTEFFFDQSTKVQGYVSGIHDLGKVTKVPEPETLALLGLGLLGFGCRAFRRNAA